MQLPKYVKAFKFKVNGTYESLFSYLDLDLCIYAADLMVKYMLHEDSSYVLTDDDRKQYDIVIYDVLVDSKSKKLQT